jgi:2-oxoglutarate ferredoxin oxidoreductase subunit beta
VKIVFERPSTLTDAVTHYCPGCGHGVIHRLVAETIERLGVEDRVIAVPSIGCSGALGRYLAYDSVAGAHGRGPAIATGIKRALPDAVVFSYQGDGDLASIGAAEILHAANRGEQITVIYVNNAVYGMTGGQMAPTTLLGQVTSTSPFGREISTTGWPMRVAELLATLPGVKYSARVCVFDAANVIKAGAAIRKAFEVQLKGLGFGIVEVLSQCPTNWRMAPRASVKWAEEHMVREYPLGEFKTPEGDSQCNTR